MQNYHFVLCGPVYPSPHFFSYCGQIRILTKAFETGGNSTPLFMYICEKTLPLPQCVVLVTNNFQRLKGKNSFQKSSTSLRTVNANVTHSVQTLISFYETRSVPEIVSSIYQPYCGEFVKRASGSQ